jgi:hypothetical protein
MASRTAAATSGVIAVDATAASWRSTHVAVVVHHLRHHVRLHHRPPLATAPGDHRHLERCGAHGVLADRVWASTGVSARRPAADRDAAGREVDGGRSLKPRRLARSTERRRAHVDAMRAKAVLHGHPHDVDEAPPQSPPRSCGRPGGEGGRTARAR